MNRHSIANTVRISTVARTLFSAAAIAAATLPGLADAPSASKTYTLFMGDDISVGTGSEAYPVKDVSGSSWVVEVNGQPKVVSPKDRPINLKIVRSPKITEVSATLADLKGTPAYTFENDPSVKLTRALANAAQLNAGYESALSQAQAALAHAQAEASAVNGTSGASPAQGPRDANGETARLAGVVNQTSVSAGADLEMTGERGSSLGYDAMEVTFEVSSERRLNSPYVVTITRFHEKGSEPGMLRQLVYAKALDPIGNHPSAVRFLEGGFPLAFELKNFEVHLYNLGAEVATNVAPQREQLTRDEAFNYVKTRYIRAHQDATLPATPVMGRLPTDLAEHLADRKYGETFYVRVSEDGLADEPFFDAACTKKVGDPYLESVVRSIRFKPALAQGKPVEAIASLNLGQLKI